MLFNRPVSKTFIEKLKLANLINIYQISFETLDKEFKKSNFNEMNKKSIKSELLILKKHIDNYLNDDITKEI